AGNHQSLQQEHQAERCQDRIHLELAPALGPVHQWLERYLVDAPVEGKCQRRNDEKPEDGVDRERGEQPEGDEASSDKRLAIGEIHDARDAVLERKAQRYQRVGPAQQYAGDDDLHETLLPMRSSGAVLAPEDSAARLRLIPSRSS